MYAIILSFDERINLAKLIINSYNELWPDNPFTFIVPFNNKHPHFNIDNVQYVKCKKYIKPTIKSLLQNIPDNEFVFWAFDDIYPISINTNVIEYIYI